MYKTEVLTGCCCAGSGEQDVMEDVKRERNVYISKKQIRHI